MSSKAIALAVVGVGLALYLIGIGEMTGSHGPSEPAKAEDTSPTCKTDWKLCKDNFDVLLNYQYGMSSPKAYCYDAAMRSAKFGDPKLPRKFAAFDKLALEQPEQLGMVRLLEDDAQFQNGFGAYAHVQVVCDYDFATHGVANIKVNQ